MRAGMCMEGGPDFFEMTKAFHNSLTWECLSIRSARAISKSSCDYNRRNIARTIPLDARFVVIHDPQPAAFIEKTREGAKQTWIWRCHIDLSRPDLDVWNFLESVVNPAMTALFSHRPSFRGNLQFRNICFILLSIRCRIRIAIWMPSFIEDVLVRIRHRSEAADPDADFPLRSLQGPAGVLRAYRIVKRYFDCQLVLAGGGASDDPEGSAVLAEVREAAGNDPDVFILELPRRAAGSQRSATRVDRGHSEEPPRRVRAHGRRGVVEEEAGRRLRRGRHSDCR